MDFAVRLHFRTMPESGARRDGFVGGYGLFLGRFSSFERFMTELTRYLMEMGYVDIEIEDSWELNGVYDVNPGEQQELFENLHLHPIQYRTLHMYTRDDA